MAHTVHTTHRCIPLLYVIEGMNTNVRTSSEAEDLDPKKQIRSEEFINRDAHFLGITAAAGDLHKVFCPESASVFQCVPDVGRPARRKISNLAEDRVVIQVADVLLQFSLHRVETRK